MLNRASLLLLACFLVLILTQNPTQDSSNDYLLQADGSNGQQNSGDNDQFADYYRTFDDSDSARTQLPSQMSSTTTYSYNQQPLTFTTGTNTVGYNSSSSSTNTQNQPTLTTPIPIQTFGSSGDQQQTQQSTFSNTTSSSYNGNTGVSSSGINIPSVLVNYGSTVNTNSGYSGTNDNSASYGSSGSSGNSANTGYTSSGLGINSLPNNGNNNLYGSTTYTYTSSNLYGSGNNVLSGSGSSSSNNGNSNPSALVTNIPTYIAPSSYTPSNNVPNQNTSSTNITTTSYNITTTSGQGSNSSFNGQSAYGQIVVDSSGAQRTQMYPPNCASYNRGACERCSFRFVNIQGVCQPVNPLCATWDANGGCLTCYSGYSICENGCVMLESCAPNGTYDPNCRRTVNGTCQECSFGFYFNQNGICTQISPFCKTNSNNGTCLSCYAGYGLSYGNCVLLPNPSGNNPYCTTWQGTICVNCSASSWKNGTTCVPFDAMCRTSNTYNGQCLSCYSGYTLVNNNCVIIQGTIPYDLLCRQWNSAGVCIQCAQKAYYQNNMCVAVDELCRTFDSNNGRCLSCYVGYNLTQSGKCVVVPPVDTNTNQYCAIWNGTICVQCAQNSYFNSARICIPSNPYCATTGSNQICLSCYIGYVLQNGNCTVPPPDTYNPNPFCSTFNGPICLQCVPRSYNRSGTCTAVNTLCRTWSNTTGACQSCYNGYILQNGLCVIDNTYINNNPLCRSFNGSVCVACATRSYLVNGICIAVNDQCNTWNSYNGQCTSCYNGYALNNGQCVYIAPPVQPPGPSANFDIYCSRNGYNGECTQCFYGFKLVSGRCVADFQNTPCAKDPRFCK